MDERVAARAPTISFDEKKVEAIFAELNQCQLPGAAVGIAIDGIPRYRKGFGLASMELPVVLSPTIRMRIGSTSKHFTSLAYLLLCEEGRANIDDPIATYVPELHPSSGRVTVRQLMGHISGLRDAVEISRQFSGTARSVSSEELLALYGAITDVNAPPGAAWIYNNGAYLLLSVAIERITGQTLEDFLRERIFEPVGMFDTLLRRFDTDFVPNSATLHMTNRAGAFEKSYLGTGTAGAGGIVSTVDDMLRWLAHMDTPKIGSRETWRALKSSQRLINGAPTGYGLGLITSRYRGVETLFHGGGVMGGNSQMLKVPGAGLDVVVMVNRHDVLAMHLANRILEACLPGLKPPTPSSALFATGTFHSPTTGRVIQLFARDREQVVSIDGFEWPFVREPDGLLRPEATWNYIQQTIRPVGPPERPTRLRFCDYGDVDELVAVQAPSNVNMKAIAGRYWSETTGVEVTIEPFEGGARLRTMGRFGSAEYQLQCLAEDIWRASSMSAVQWWDAILTFEGNAFRFSSGRTRQLTFQRKT